MLSACTGINASAIRARDGELAKQWDRAKIQALAIEEDKKMMLERLEAVEKKEKEKAEELSHGVG